MSTVDLGQRTGLDVDPSVRVRVVSSAKALQGGYTKLDRLPPEQRVRLDRIRVEQARVDFLAARHACADVVADLIAVDRDRVGLVQECVSCGKQDHGPPHAIVDGRRPEGVSVSWAHSDGVVAAAAGRNIRIGVDVERLPAAPLEAGLLRVSLTPDEERAVRASVDPNAAFLGIWTLKEALVKIGEHSLDEVVASPLGELLANIPDVSTATWQDRGTRAIVGLVLASSLESASMADDL
jgi:4'-phosphopantetheinyl transferase EntD